MDIEKELKTIVVAKQGNKEMAIFFDPDSNDWTISLGNPTNWVMLGEVSGEIEVVADTLRHAITKMKARLEI